MFSTVRRLNENPASILYFFEDAQIGCQQGRSERKPEAYSSWYVARLERRENEVDDQFQRPIVSR